MYYSDFGDFGLQETFQKWIAPKSIEIDMDKLHMKFSALNVDFEGPSLDFLGSSKLRTSTSKSGKSCCFTKFLASFFVKTVADRHGHADYHNKH